jgi:hypothetical protein
VSVAPGQAGGVALGGGDRATLTPSNHRLVDSDIGFTDEWVKYEVPAVSQQGVGTTVAHNHIHGPGPPRAVKRPSRFPM